MNFVPGVLRRQNGEAMVEFADGTRLHPPARLAPGAGVDGQRVIYGARPEHLRRGSAGEGFPTRVAVVEPTGANTEVYSRFGDTEFISIFRERHDFVAGDALHLVPDHLHSHLFDAETGQALPRQ